MTQGDGFEFGAVELREKTLRIPQESQPEFTTRHLHGRLTEIRASDDAPIWILLKICPRR
jgi:hypothetical protein